MRKVIDKVTYKIVAKMATILYMAIILVAGICFSIYDRIKKYAR